MTVVLITGGAGGIGAALAREWRRRGATVVTTDLTPGADDIALDVTDSDAFRSVVDDIIGAHGHIDVLHNNAGVSIGGPFLELSDRHWDLALGVNLRGVVNGVQAVLPHMARRRRGHIVNTASLNGLVVTPGNAPYVASKHAVVALTRTLRIEAAAWNVRATALCPGAIKTPLLDNFNAGAPATAFDDTARKMATSIPPMDPDDMARIVVRRLASNPAVISVPRGYVSALALAERLLPGPLHALMELQWRRTVRSIGLRPHVPTPATTD